MRLDVYIYLLILGALIKTTGTVFFGVDFFPLIITIVIVGLLIDRIKSNEALIKKIKKMLKL